MSDPTTVEPRRVRFGPTLLLVVSMAFAIAVPIVLLVSNARDKPRQGPRGLTLSAAETHGRTLFAATCANCHTLAAVAAVAHVGPNLDVLRPSQALVKVAIRYGFANGNGQMPTGLYSGANATDIAQFVAAVTGR